MQEVLTAELASRSELVRVVRAALLNEVAEVALAGVPLAERPFTLRLTAPGLPAVSVGAEIAGDRQPRGIPLRLRPLDPSHVPELTAIAGGSSSSLEFSLSGSAIFDAAPPLPPPVARPAPGSTTDPSVLGLRAAAAEGEEDATLTIPGRPSAFPPPPRNEREADTERGLGPGPAEPIATLRGTGQTEVVDFDDSIVVSPAGARIHRRDEWTKTDPSMGNLLGDLEPATAVAPAAHPADDDSVSVIFGDEATIPGSEPRLTGRVESDASPMTQDAGRPLHDPIGGAPLTVSPVTSSRRAPRTPKRAQAEVGVGQVIANKYRIQSLIGRGAVGSVYKAEHTDLARTVAIKVLHPHCRADPHLLAAFRTEARAASHLDHPAVTIVHDFGEEPDGLVYIVMEFIDGVTLQATLDQERRIEPTRALRIMLQVTAALSIAHDRGIVHRDVKPDNILLVPSRDDDDNPTELVKVCDFGIAALEAGPDPSDGEFTAGTPEYMAPEQAKGSADGRTDVYATGIVLYEMLAGWPPFVGATPSEVLTKQASERARGLVEQVPGLDPSIEAIVMKAIEKSPERRFATMRELRAQIRAALKRLGG